MSNDEVKWIPINTANNDISDDCKAASLWLCKSILKDLGLIYIDLDDLKVQNESSDTCVRCQKPTKIFAQITKYCPTCEYELSGEVKDKKNEELKPFDDKDAVTKKTDLSSTVSLNVKDYVQINTGHLKEGDFIDGVYVWEEHIIFDGRQSTILEMKMPQMPQFPKGWVKLVINSKLAFHPDWTTKV